MEEIHLQRGRWKYDPSNQLGPPGGFGAVFKGESDDGEAVAVKRLKLTANDAAHRELEVAEELSDRSFRNVLPVFDAGEDAGSGRYFLVMPEAKHSLKARLDQDGTFSESRAAEILLEIATGLQEVPDIVHRDLKPANVLKHSGQWKIADFGIAKFVAESTSLRTLKDCLTPAYGAPEQWRMESAVPETDVYALGGIGHTLLTGSPPFSGPTPQEYRKQHLNQQPPEINASPQLKSLLTGMLRKVPDARPSIERVSETLEAFLEDFDGGSDAGNRLAQAAAAVAQEESQKEAKRERRARQRKKRRNLGNAALDILWSQVEELFDRIKNTAPAADRVRRGRMEMGKGGVEVSEMGVNPISSDAFSSSGWDVIVGAVIEVEQSNPEYIWSSSLWYAKRHENDEYRWREASYFTNAFSKHRRQFEPYFLDVPQEADIAHSNVVGSHQVAWGPSPIDDENKEDFFERWEERFAQAAQGHLSHPSRLPLD